MNMLYEAVKERGSMVIVPSSAVETMGLGGTLATASLGGANAAYGDHFVASNNFARYIGARPAERALHLPATAPGV